MEAQQARWGALDETQIIRENKTGKLWKIVRMNDTHVGLRTRDGEEKIIKRPKNDAAVTVMVLTNAELGAILREQLGAEPLFWENTEKKSALTCYPFETMKRDAQAYHLKYMHHAAIDNGKADKKLDLVKIHDELHAENKGRGLPHVHLGRPEVEKHRRI